MFKQWAYRITLVASIFALAASLQALAFTEPPQNPPGGDVAAPINTGATAQDKSDPSTHGAWITADGLGSRYGALLATMSGDVGIGTTTPQGNLDVENSTNNASICLNDSCISNWSQSTGNNPEVRAYARFDGTTCTTKGSTCTILNSYDVSSITRVSTYTIYKVVFTHTLPSSNYAFDMSAGMNPDNEYPVTFLSDDSSGPFPGTGATASTFEFGVLYQNGGGSYFWDNSNNVSVTITM